MCIRDRYRPLNSIYYIIWAKPTSFSILTKPWNETINSLQTLSNHPPIPKAATTSSHTISSKHEISAFSNKAHRYNAPTLPSQMKNDVRTTSPTSKADDNSWTQATSTTTKARRIAPMQAIMPRRNIPYTAAHESEVPSPPTLPNIWTGWNNIRKS